MWIDAKHPADHNRILFRYDPERDIIQIQERGIKYPIDLAELRAQHERRKQEEAERLERRAS